MFFSLFTDKSDKIQPLGIINATFKQNIEKFVEKGLTLSESSFLRMR